MTHRIDFTDRYDYSTKQNNYDNRPMAEVTLVGPTGSVRLWAVVDSGADYSQVSAADANAAGINVAGAPSASVLGATGSVSLPQVPNVQINVEGISTTADVIVGGTQPLLGRQSFLAAIKFGMDDAGWLYE